MRRVRRSYLDVLTFIESFGHTLLSKEEDISEQNGVVKAKTKLLIKCNQGHVFETTFDCYKRGKYKCIKCVQESGICRRKYSFEDIVKLFGEEGYSINSPKSDYKNMETVLNVTCPRGHSWTSSYHNFKAGYKCPDCKKEDSENVHVKQCEVTLEEHGYTILDFYRAKYDCFTNSIFTIKCKNNHTSLKAIKSIRAGKLTCLQCYGKLKKTLEEVISEFNLYGFTVISHNGYENNQSRFLISCENGHKLDTTYANFKQKNQMCALCSEENIGASKGEKRVSRHLDKQGVNYIYQFKFPDCKFKQELPFDFYLPEYNLCIEYDGIQHDEPVVHFGGLESFIDTKIRDTIKNIYCEKNSINLIRISYKDYNKIEKILDFKIQGESSTTRDESRTP